MDNINHFLNLEIMKLAKQIEIYTEVLRVHHQNLYIKEYSKIYSENKHITLECNISKFVRKIEQLNELQNELENENIKFKIIKEGMEDSFLYIEKFFKENK